MNVRLSDAIRKAQEALAGGPVDVALMTVDDLENLRPTRVPDAPFASPEVRAVFRGDSKTELSDLQRSEYLAYRDGIVERSQAIAENKRRLQNVLWAFEKLALENRPEVELVRTFLREEWGYTGALPTGTVQRQAVIEQVASGGGPRDRLMRPLRRVEPANENLRFAEGQDANVSKRGSPTR